MAFGHTRMELALVEYEHWYYFFLVGGNEALVNPVALISRIERMEGDWVLF